MLKPGLIFVILWNSFCIERILHPSLSCTAERVDRVRPHIRASIIRNDTWFPVFENPIHGKVPLPSEKRNRLEFTAARAAVRECLNYFVFVTTKKTCRPCCQLSLTTVSENATIWRIQKAKISLSSDEQSEICQTPCTGAPGCPVCSTVRHVKAILHIPLAPLTHCI